MSGLCAPCREDCHASHITRVSLTWYQMGDVSKKGPERHMTGRRETTCRCVICDPELSKIRAAAKPQELPIRQLCGGVL